MLVCYFIDNCYVSSLKKDCKVCTDVVSLNIYYIISCFEDAQVLVDASSWLRSESGEQRTHSSSMPPPPPPPRHTHTIDVLAAALSVLFASYVI